MESDFGLMHRRDSESTEMLEVYRLVTKKLHIRFAFP
jgi:hypothetical protein